MGLAGYHDLMPCKSDCFETQGSQLRRWPEFFQGASKISDLGILFNLLVRYPTFTVLSGLQDIG